MGDMVTDEVDGSSSAMVTTPGVLSWFWSSSITAGSVTRTVLTLGPPLTSGTCTQCLLPKKAIDRTKDSSSSEG